MSSQEHEQKVYTEDTCCVCLEKLGKTNTITFRCGHMCAHASCFLPTKLSNCPMCRARILDAPIPAPQLALENGRHDVLEAFLEQLASIVPSGGLVPAVAAAGGDDRELEEKIAHNPLLHPDFLAEPDPSLFEIIRAEQRIRIVREHEEHARRIAARHRAQIQEQQLQRPKVQCKGICKNGLDV